MFTRTALVTKEAECELLHARQQTLAVLDTGTGEVVSCTLLPRRQRSAGVLCPASAPSAGRHRSHWTNAVVSENLFQAQNGGVSDGAPSQDCQ
jgi:hypothetical protein